MESLQGLDWSLVEPKNVPTELNKGIHGHSCVRDGNNLWIFGGACHGWARNELFRYRLDSNEWERIHPKLDYVL